MKEKTQVFNKADLELDGVMGELWKYKLRREEVVRLRLAQNRTCDRQTNNGRSSCKPAAVAPSHLRAKSRRTRKAGLMLPVQG